MKKFLIVLALIVGGASLPANANPAPYPLAGKWEMTLTAGDLRTLNYEPRQNLLWEFELLPSGAYEFRVLAYGFDGRPFVIASQDIEPGAPPPADMRFQTSSTDALGTVTIADYELHFDFVSRSVRGRYAKRIHFTVGAFPIYLYGWVNGKRITPEQTKLPQPLPKAPSFYEEEQREARRYNECLAQRKIACVKITDKRLPPKERDRWKRTCERDSGNTYTYEE